jgi:hypothetical protein
MIHLSRAVIVYKPIFTTVFSSFELFFSNISNRDFSLSIDAAKKRIRDSNRLEILEAIGRVRSLLFKKSELLAQKNIQYGFARNLCASSAIAASVSSVIATTAVAAGQHMALKTSLIAIGTYMIIILASLHL